MPKPQHSWQMWCIIYTHPSLAGVGGPWYFSKARSTLADFAAQHGFRRGWRGAYDQGYRCIRVEVREV